MKLWSHDFNEEEHIPRKFSGDGQDVNPHLAWNDVPPGTKSLALIVDDPDAPMGLWTHWLVEDIPPDVREVKQGSPPPGKQVENDFGKKDYGGPAPPGGTHRYFFKLYAIDREKLKARNKKKFYKLVEKHKLDEAQLMGYYSKK